MMKSSLRGRAIASAIAFAAALCCVSPASADPRENQWEVQVGQQEFAQLAQRGEIVMSSPFYNELNPVAQRIAAVADPQYFMPFHFILVNERSPNAFALPGGNVYVTTGMMAFAQSQDELAGVLCHEVSHDIHHDAFNREQQDQRVQTFAGMLGALLWNNPLGQAAVGLGAGAQVMTFSRSDESNADRAGAYTCTQAGYNPYGLVSLFTRMQPATGNRGGRPEMLSDHPRDDHRISDLEALFRSDPTTFGRFKVAPSSFAPLAAPGTQLGYPLGYHPPPGYQTPPGYQPPPGYPPPPGYQPPPGL